MTGSAAEQADGNQDTPNYASAAEVRQIYRKHLRNGLNEDAATGFWLPEPEKGPSALLPEIEQAEKSGTVLKETDQIKVFHSPVLGRDTLIKRYDLPRWTDRLRYLHRPLRGRRAWAASRTLTDLGIPTPEPLGFLEPESDKAPRRSYFMMAFLPETETFREWAREIFDKVSHEERVEIGELLMEDLLSLYRHSIYHGDTKASNILVVSPDDPERRQILWIDLECVRCGVRVSRRQIIRNLVQLNGSLFHSIPIEYRQLCMQMAAREYPWIAEARVVERIREWTARRLNRNVSHR